MCFTVTPAGRGEGERFETCVNVVQEALPIALARPYSQFVLPPGTKVNTTLIKLHVQMHICRYSYYNGSCSYSKHSML